MRVGLFLVGLFFLVFLSSPASAEVTQVVQDDLVVTWYPLQEGISHFVYNISVENLRPSQRSVDLSTVISDTSFPIDDVRNLVFYELEDVAYTVSVPVYGEEAYACSVFNNATRSSESASCTRLVQTGVREELRHELRKKVLPHVAALGAGKYKAQVGLVSLPMTGAVQGENVRWFRLEFDVPIAWTGLGWGSMGKTALEIDGLEYHPWWNSSWNRKRNITITNNNAMDALPSGYTVNITLDTTGPEFLDNGYDVRIVYNGDTELDRVNSTAFNSAMTVIWFQTQASIPAGGSTGAYEVYYGNPSASSPPSNGSRVWLFFDDFNDNSLSPEWVTSGTVSETNQELQLGSTAAFARYEMPSSNSIWYTGEISFPDQRNQYAAMVRSDTSLNQHWGLVFGDHNDGNLIYFAGTGQQPQNGNLNSTGFTLEQDTWYGFDVRVRADNYTELRVWNKGSTIPPGATLTYTGADTTYQGRNLSLMTDSSLSFPVRFDNIRVAKYLSPEPTTTVSSTEEAQNITFSSPSYSPGYGGVGDSFTFNITLHNSYGDDVNASLYVNNAYVGSDVVVNGSTASILWTSSAVGSYTYHWGAVNLGGNLTGRYPGTGEATGPYVNPDNYEENVTIVSGTSKLVAGVYWYSTSSNSSISISLSNGTDSWGEFQVPTFIRDFKSVTIPLPILNYNITLYSGYRELTVNNPVPGSWSLHVGHTNVSRIETEIRRS